MFYSFYFILFLFWIFNLLICFKQARRRILAPANRAAQGPTTTVPFPSNRSGPSSSMSSSLLPSSSLALSHLPSHYSHSSHHSSSIGPSSLFDVSGTGLPMPAVRRASMPAAMADLHHHHQDSGHHGHGLQLYHPSSLSGSGGSSSGLHHLGQGGLHSSQSSEYLRGHHSASALSMHRQQQLHSYGGSAMDSGYGRMASMGGYGQQQQQQQSMGYLGSPSAGGMYHGTQTRLPAITQATRGYTFPDSSSGAPTGASGASSDGTNGAQ